ncbi:MAG TPA: ribosome-associated translation inhibitor RaiA [Actinomycetes bacterium]|jgi:putative sigma-54 modulation protein|nr:ribosome-associated translation inhibitor RaiA [Actinomycetes bacterium]
MQVTVKGKNTDVSDKLRAHAERKLAKVERFDDRILAMDVEFSEERNPRVADAHRVEVTLTTKSRLVRAHASAPDPTAAVDRVIDRLKSQIKKLKSRRVDRTQHAEGTKSLAPLLDEPQAAEQPVGPAIVRFKRIEMKPMAPEEAIERMDLLGHDFFLFSNAETEQANVVYRRRSGDYGLIEPET